MAAMEQMPVTSELDARLEMKAFIERARAPFGEWYVGVAADVQQRIEEHGLEASDWYLARRLAKAETAHKLAQYLIDEGCDGNITATDEAATCVYAYWKRGHTDP